MPAPNKKTDVWKRIKRGAPNECWLWTGSTDSSGYGVFGYAGGHFKATRVVMELLGANLDGKVVMHSCDTPRCCNPAHLSVGTQTENNLDAVRKGRWTQAKPGSANAYARLTEPMVISIRAEWDAIPKFPSGLPAYGSAGKLAKKYGIRLRHLNTIVKRRGWTHV